MIYVVLVLMMIGGVVAIVVSTQAKKKEAERLMEAERLKTTIPGAAFPRAALPAQPAAAAQRSSDSIYAEINNMWVCQFCETLNSKTRSVCIACGARRIV